jgi:hypothetical protein
MRDNQGSLIIQTDEISTHRVSNKEIPSNFFGQPNAEHVSAVLFSNAGTVSKFTRMGYQAGYHRGNVIITRRGVAWNSDPNASEALEFSYRLDEDPGTEPWGSGVEVFHNPNALKPIPDDFFADAAQTHLREGAPVSWAPRFLPFASFTLKTSIDIPLLTPVEESPTDVGTILRKEFDSRKLIRPPYAEANVPFTEVAWFADKARRIVGTVVRWHGEEDYGFIILGPDNNGVWRAIEFDAEFPSLEAAASEISAKMILISRTGQTIFPQD